MKEFFECNLDREAPEHLYWELHEEFEKVVARIYERTAKLNEALQYVNMKPETFQKITGDLFQSEAAKYGNADHFDSMTPMDLASYANLSFVEEVPYTRYECRNADVLFDIVYATTKEWELLRHIGIGGSDDAVVQGLNPKRTLYGLFHDKRGTPVKINFNEDNQAVFDRGHAVENNVIKSFCELTGATELPETRMFRSRTHPHCIADVDSLILMPDGKLRIYEAKSTIINNQDAWKDNTVPVYYQIQCQHYAGVLDDPDIEGINIGCLFVIDWKMVNKYLGSQYSENMFVARYIERNPTKECEQLDNIERFWEDYVEPGVEPPLANVTKEATHEVLSVIGPSSNTAEIKELIGDSVPKVKRMVEIQNQIESAKAKLLKPLESEYNTLKLALIQSLENSISGVVDLGNGVQYDVSYKPRKKTVINTELLSIKYPDIYGEIVHVIPEASRTFDIKMRTKSIRKNP